MYAIVLLGVNFVRSQWIPLAVMTAYMAGIGGVFRLHVQPADVVFFLRWHAGYAVFLVGMMAIPALQMERKSRRVLAVLSKGIHRWQYLGGLLCGCTMIAALLCAMVGGIAAWLCRQGGIVPDGLTPIMIALFCCCVAAAATGLFFATFLHPFLATAATSILLAVPFVLESMGWRVQWEIFPVAAVFHLLLRFNLQTAGSHVWTITAAALGQIAVLWAVAAVVFARRDVTISPE